MKRILTKSAMWLFITSALAVVTAAAALQFPEGEGKKLLEDRCTNCHGLDQVSPLKHNRDAWKSLLERMVTFGAQMDPKEIDVAADYLTKNFGSPGGAAAPAGADDQAAQKLVDGVCASCHDSDLVKGTQATKAGWSDIVTRMNGRGAGLTDKDVEMLVNYLAKTYAPK